MCRTAGEMCSVIVSKALPVTRAKTKEKSVEALLLYIEMEKQETVLVCSLVNKVHAHLQYRLRFFLRNETCCFIACRKLYWKAFKANNLNWLWVVCKCYVPRFSKQNQPTMKFLLLLILTLITVFRCQLCTWILYSHFSDFGSKIVSIKTILKPSLALLEDRDKSVRDETKRLLVEIYRWIGAALKPQLANLKPVQVSFLHPCLHRY